MLDAAAVPMADLVRGLIKTWGTPTMSPHCAAEVKHGVVARVIERYQAISQKGGKVAGRAIRSLSTVNGIRNYP